MDAYEKLRLALLDARLDRDAATISRTFQLAQAEHDLAQIGTRPQGFRPDGRPVTSSEKAEIFRNYERVRAEHQQRHRPAPVIAASADGPSLIIRQLYGL